MPLKRQQFTGNHLYDCKAAALIAMFSPGGSGSGMSFPTWCGYKWALQGAFTDPHDIVPKYCKPAWYKLGGLVGSP